VPEAAGPAGGTMRYWAEEWPALNTSATPLEKTVAV
jgi:hypothetical protein